MANVGLDRLHTRVPERTAEQPDTLQPGDAEAFEQAQREFEAGETIPLEQLDAAIAHAESQPSPQQGWIAITPDNFPKSGDEVRKGGIVRAVDTFATDTPMQFWAKNGWTHYRAIGPLPPAPQPKAGDEE
jgi:hypothetical protein